MELGDRKKYIGGSDIAAVMGLSRYKTPLKLWCEKTGRIELDDLSDNEYVYWGNKHEETVAEEFEKRTKKLVFLGNEYIHSAYPFLKAHTDRTIYDSFDVKQENNKIVSTYGNKHILECKTSGNAKDWKDNEMPIEYILQVNFYMGISGIHHAYIACLINGNKFIIRELSFDEELYNKEVEAAVKFWDMVQNNIMPMVTNDDGETLLQLYPESNNQTITVSDNELDDSIAFLCEAETELKENEKQIDAIKNEIKVRMGENESMITERYIITWKDQESERVDIEKLKADGLFDKYKKVSSTRVLRKKVRTL